MVATLVVCLAVVLCCARWVRRPRPSGLTPASLADLVFRQPDRVLAAVPWYLAQWQASGVSVTDQVEEAAVAWSKMGEFTTQSDSLRAMAALAAEPSPQSLADLLNLLFGEPNNVLVLEASGDNAECRLAVECLRVLHAVQTGGAQMRAAAGRCLPSATEVLGQWEVAMQRARAETRRTGHADAAMDVCAVMKEWRRLAIGVCKVVDPAWEDSCGPDGRPLGSKETRHNRARRLELERKRRRQAQRQPQASADAAPSTFPNERDMRYLGCFWHAAVEVCRPLTQEVG